MSRWLCVVLAFGLAGCTADSGVREAVTSFDSAGVAITESSMAGSELAFSEAPILSLGSEAIPALMFSRVRGVARLSDGRVVVADGASRELRYFDSDGNHLHTVGRGGSGPGEFEEVTALLRLPNDSLVVNDRRLGRFTVLDPDGRVAEVSRTNTPPTVIGRLSDGSPVFTVYADADASEVAEGILRPGIAVVRRAADGRAVDTIAKIADEEEIRILDGGRVFTFVAPFSQPPISSVANDRVFTVGLGSADIHMRHPDGQIERIIRPRIRPGRVTSADVERYRSQSLEGYGGPSEVRALHERALSIAPAAEYFPSYTTILASPQGHVWAELFRWPVDSEPKWRVFGTRGEWLVDLTVPRGLRVFDIGVDYIAGVLQDELGVEYVQVYALEGLPRP